LNNNLRKIKKPFELTKGAAKQIYTNDEKLAELPKSLMFLFNPIV
jgi:hypothetical protein